MTVREVANLISRINELLEKVNTADIITEELQIAEALLRECKKVIRNIKIENSMYDWVSVEIEKPEIGHGLYLVLLDGGYADVAVYRKEGFCPWYAYHYEKCPPEWEKEVIAWMPIKPYTEERNEN